MALRHTMGGGGLRSVVREGGSSTRAWYVRLTCMLGEWILRFRFWSLVAAACVAYALGYMLASVVVGGGGGTMSRRFVCGNGGEEVRVSKDIQRAVSTMEMLFMSQTSDMIASKEARRLKAEAEIKVEEPKASDGLPHRLNALSLTVMAPKRFVAPRVCVVQSDNRWAPAPGGPKDVQTSVRLAVAYADKVGAKYILYNANARGAGKPVAIDSACRTGECDVIFYIDTDAFVEEFNDDVYKELSFLFDEGAIVIAGQDYLATIRANNKDLNYLADFNAGEIIVNCNARKYADFIANWKVLAHHEKEDQVALGMLQRQHRFKNAIQWDARFLGVYGRFTRHFPGKTKPQMKAYVDARAGEAPFWDGAARKIDPQAAREIEGRTIVRRSSWFRKRKR